MSKDNLFLGFARGSVGDVTFTHINGVQVARARNRHPKNPQTPVQLLQRVVSKTSSVAYSLLQQICNHSFQGYQEGTPNQSRFAKLNIAKFRRRLEDVIYSGNPEDILSSGEANFAYKSSSLAEMNSYVVSEGSVRSSDVRFSSGLFGLFFPIALPGGTTQSTLTYQNVVDALSLQRGDQLTFMFLSTDDSDSPDAAQGCFNGFSYARVILEPSDGDMSSTFFNGTAINKPSARNEGDVSLAFVAAAGDVPAHFTFSTAGMATAANMTNSVAATAVIASRLSGGIWQRSSQELVLRPSDITIAGHLQYDTNVHLLGEAVASYMTVQASSLYLNQSENF